MRKTCTVCGSRKKLAEFYKGSGKYGRRGKCIECTRKITTERYWDNVDEARAKATTAARGWRAKNREKAREVSRNNQRRHVRELRAKIRELLGDKCAACPVTNPKLLHIEHRADDGRLDREAFGGNKTAYYNHVLSSPAGYQLMCPNCNHRKRLKTLPGPTTDAARYSKKYAAKLRREALLFLGGVCKECNEDDLDVLCVDHKAGKGRQARLSCGGSEAMYRDVPVNPQKYQCLCHNCNWLKRHRCEEW